MVCKIQNLPSSSHPPVITHSLSIASDFTWTLHVYGRRVHMETCDAIQSTPTFLDPSSTKMLLSRVDSLQVCAGNPDQWFVVCRSKTGVGSVRAYQDSYYPVTLNGKLFMTTVRASACELLVGGSKCLHCRKYRPVLRALSRKLGKNRETSATQASSHTNYRYLSTPEKQLACAT